MDISDLGALLGESLPPAGAGGQGIWVVAEIHENALSAATLEALGAARGLADRLGATVGVALLGADVAGLAGTLIAHGADRVALAEDARLSPFDLETHLAVLSARFTQAPPEVLLLVASPDGDDLAARLASRLGTGCVSGCTGLDLDEATRTVIARRPAYGGLYEEEWLIPQIQPGAPGSAYEWAEAQGAAEEALRSQVFTLRPGAFTALPADPGRSGEIEALAVSLEDVRRRVRDLGPAEYAGPVDHHGERAEIPLHRAQRVVAVGRDLRDQGGEGLALARQLAEALGAVLAGDHTAYELGWVADRYVVGITGPAIAPELYIACGIRGDAHHLAGMSDSRFVVAIHPDPQAPIFKTADLGVVGEPVAVLRALLGQA
jgi:electron transfer flavoprotein alpha subunit